MFHKRTVSSVFLVILFFLIVTLSKKVYFLPILLVIINAIGIFGALEFYTMVENKGLKVFKIYGTIASGILLTTVFLERIVLRLEHFELEGMVLFFIVCLFFVLQSSRKKVDISAFSNIFITLGGIFYVSWLFSFLLKINFLFSVDGRLCLAYLLLVTKITDIGAYIVGSIWGKNKLIPHVSPNKTVEGSLGGIVMAMVASYMGGMWLLPGNLSALHLLALGFITGVVAQVGDLAESMLKRDANVKDSGSYIPGMGGVLDLLDSVLFTAPFIYFYLTGILHIK